MKTITIDGITFEVKNHLILNLWAKKYNVYFKITPKHNYIRYEEV